MPASWPPPPRRPPRVFAYEQAEVHLRRALQLLRPTPAPDPQTELSLLLEPVPADRDRPRLGRRGGPHGRRPGDRSWREAGALDDDTARLWWSLFFFLLDRDDASYVEVATPCSPPSRRVERRATTGAAAVGHAARAAVHLISIFAPWTATTATGHSPTCAPRAPRRGRAAADLAAFDEHLHVMLLLIEGYWAALTGDRSATGAAPAAVALADADGRPFPRAVARTLGVACPSTSRTPRFVRDLAR